jgi:hypothetical protein
MAVSGLLPLSGFLAKRFCSPRPVRLWLYYTLWQRERKKPRHPPAAGAARINALVLTTSAFKIIKVRKELKK